MVYGPIIAVDFDGTIKEDPNYLEYGKLADNCKEVLERLKKAGCRLILWTCRNDIDNSLDKARKYLMEQDILHLFDKINENVEGLQWPSVPKVYADYYLDDRAIGGFPGFLDAEKIIMQHPYFKCLEE